MNDGFISLSKRRYIEAKLGQLRCYDALGEFETLLNESLDLWQRLPTEDMIIMEVEDMVTPKQQTSNCIHHFLFTNFKL